MERAAAAPQACAAAISTVMDKVRQKVENSNDLDLSDESSSINLETLSAFMQGDGRTILDNALRRFADDQSSLASRGVAAIKRGAEEIDKPKEEKPYTSALRDTTTEYEPHDDTCPQQPEKKTRTPSTPNEDDLSSDADDRGTQYFAMNGQGRRGKTAGDDTPSCYSYAATEEASSCTTSRSSSRKGTTRGRSPGSLSNSDAPDKVQRVADDSPKVCKDYYKPGKVTVFQRMRAVDRHAWHHRLHRVHGPADAPRRPECL